MSELLKVPTMAEYMAQGKQPEVLFWVGCAGSFDDRAKKITKAFVKLLNRAQVEFAVLGTEESCTGDPAKRAGNEFLFQMQAVTNIEVLNAYEVKKIVTACPHCFNTIKNEYPELGGNYEVMHHTTFLKTLLDEGRLTCCGAGGAQMFKDAEKGDKEVNVERTEQALDVKPQIIAAGCPFCNTMMTDGVKAKEQEADVTVMDVAELIANAQDL